MDRFLSGLAAAGGRRGNSATAVNCLAAAFAFLLLAVSPVASAAIYSVSIHVQDSSGAPLNGTAVRYGPNSGVGLVFGTTNASGDVAKDLNGGTYYFGAVRSSTMSVQGPFAINANGTAATFQTTKVTVRLQECDDATGIAGGNARYWVGSTSYWFPGGVTGANGEAYAEFFAGTYKFEMLHQNTAEVKTQDISSPLVWNADRVTLSYGGSVSFGGPLGDYQWFSKPSMYLLNGTYKFHFRVPGNASAGRVDIAINSCNTTASAFALKLIDSQGNPLAGGTARMNEGTWAPIPGATGPDGLLFQSLAGLHNSIMFEMAFNGTSQQKTQDISLDSLVVFQTGRVHWTGDAPKPLQALINGSWVDFWQDMELLPGNYTFTLEGGLNQTVAVIAGQTTYIPAIGTITVAGAGDGNGTVSGPGINCAITAGAASGDCTETVLHGTSLTLAATLGLNSVFSGWDGCDTTSGTQCNITVNDNRSVTATFSRACPGVDVWSRPFSVSYYPTPWRASQNIIVVGVTNRGSAPVTVSSITPQAGEPFINRLVMPTLPKVVPPGTRRIFYVWTARGAGLNSAAAERPYFDIEMDCGTLSLA